MNLSTTRVEALSDGIIAIIITIMVIEFEVPDLSTAATTETVRHHLIKLIPYFASYFFSFMMIGIFWTNHHHMFHLLERLDNKVLWQNFFFLFGLSFIPFSTALIGANPLLPESVAFYGFNLLLTTVAFLIIRTYTLRKNLVHKDSEVGFNKQIRETSIRTKRKSYIASFIYLLAVPLAFVSVYISYALFIVPPILFFLPEGVDDERLAEKVIEKNK